MRRREQEASSLRDASSAVAVSPDLRFSCSPALPFCPPTAATPTAESRKERGDRRRTASFRVGDRPSFFAFPVCSTLYFLPFSCSTIFPRQQRGKMVGATGFEPAASWSRTKRSSQTELRPDLASHLFKRTYISSEPVPAKCLFSREPATLFKYRSRRAAERRSGCSSLCTSFHGPFWRVNWLPYPSLWSNTRRARLFV